MPYRSFARLILLGAMLGGVPLTFAQSPKVTADRADGIYEVGQPIRWRVEVGDQTATNSLAYSLKSGGRKTTFTGTLHFTNGVGWVVTQLDQPGAILLEIPPAAGRPRLLAGAVAAPRRIGLAAPRPTDFDEFWDANIRELQGIPANPRLTPGESSRPGVDYWKIMLENVRGTHIQGQLARPHVGEKLPALLIVQWAGVYPLQKSWAVERANHGWLVLNISAHDLPIDQPAAFYQEQNNGPLKEYPRLGNDDRNQSYFLRMYLSCHRAADYLASRSDWDGKTLVVMGDSQGGLQALVTAALHPKVTAALALVPAGCDLLGPQVERQGGWPQWYDSVWGKDARKVRAASRYYDVANFAPRIQCPVLIGLGLIDETCPPAGVFAAANQIKAPAEVVILTDSGHQDVRNSQAPFRHRRDDVWLPSLQAGQRAPVSPAW